MFPEKIAAFPVFRGRLAESWWNADERGLRGKTSRQAETRHVEGDHGLKFGFLNNTVSKKQTDTHAHTHTQKPHSSRDLEHQIIEQRDLETSEIEILSFQTGRYNWVLQNFTHINI